MSIDLATAFFTLPRIAGLALGLLLAALLWVRSGGGHRANRWLCAAIAALVLQSYWTYWLLFVVGPCLWLYSCRFTGLAGPRGQRLAVHFIPAAAMLLVLLPIYLAPTRPASALQSSKLVFLIAAAQMLAYWLLASLRLRRHLGGLTEDAQSPERQRFERQQRRLYICMAGWGLWVFATLLSAAG